MVTTDRVARLLRYSAEEGAFYWRARTGRACAGDRAGCVRHDGYRVIRIDGKRYLEHRLVWLVEKGRWPEGELDHRNRDRADNRITNLRPATPAQQRQNMKPRVGNVSGATGVIRCSRSGRWRAFIGLGGKFRHLGRFDTFEEARSARDAAKAALHTFYGDD